MPKLINQPPRITGARLPIERVRDISFAKRLSQLMAEREMSQSALAARIWGRQKIGAKLVAKGRDRISVWVAGKNFPARENLAKLAKALDVRTSELAPEAELKNAHGITADWSVTKPHDEAGMSFFQAARYLPDDIVHEIIGLLIKADQKSKGADRPPRSAKE